MKKSIKTLVSLILITLIFSACHNATNIYISPLGDDNNPGTFEEPLATIYKAKLEARKKNHSVNIILRKGKYFLPKTVFFDAQDSRADEAPLTFKSYKAEKVLISGAKSLARSWAAYKNGVWMAKVEDELIFDQMYVNGKPQRMARFPNYDETELVHFFWRGHKTYNQCI